MIDENGVFIEQTFEDLKQITTGYAEDVSLDPAGVVENILINFGAKILEDNESELYKSYQKQFFPASTDLDLQNPGFPRYEAQPAIGILTITNNTGAELTIGFNQILTIFGRDYSTLSNSVTIADTETGTIKIESLETGIDQNVVSNQTTWSSSITNIDIVNNYPIDGGRNIETDTEYHNRLILNHAGLVAVKNSLYVENELRRFYQDARIYVNNLANASPLPIVIPPNGCLAIIRYVGGVDAKEDDIKKASDILANRYELINNITTQSSPPHYPKSYSVYIQNTPILIYTLAAAQVKTSIIASINVTFLVGMSDDEKAQEAVNFARRYAQRISQYLSGVEGNITVNFTSLINPRIGFSISIAASIGVDNRIAPVINVEQFRALIIDAEDITPIRKIFYSSCPVLIVTFDPEEAGENVITLDITGPRYSANFSVDALFNDDSSWFDRFVIIDPANIIINIDEV